MSLKQRIRFYQQLAMLFRAGLPILAGLNRLKEKIPSREATILAEKVAAGEMLGDAFTDAGFSPFECHLIAAGQKSAQLESIFQHLAEFWSRQWDMRQAFITQLYYPVAMLHLGAVVSAMTELINGSVHAMVVQLVVNFVILYATGAAIVFLIRFTWENEAAQRVWLRVPIIGGALSTAFAYRWITALKLEFIAGVSLANAVADAWRASGFVGRERFAAEGQQAMWDGVTLSTLIRKWKRLPRDWVDFIETGEISGALEKAFVNLEVEAAAAWQLAQQRMTDWLPKIASFVILLVVGAMIIVAQQKESGASDIDAVQKQIDDAVGHP